MRISICYPLTSSRVFWICSFSVVLCIFRDSGASKKQRGKRPEKKKSPENQQHSWCWDGFVYNISKIKITDQFCWFVALSQDSHELLWLICIISERFCMVVLFLGFWISFNRSQNLHSLPVFLYISKVKLCDSSSKSNTFVSTLWHIIILWYVSKLPSFYQIVELSSHLYNCSK